MSLTRTRMYQILELEQQNLTAEEKAFLKNLIEKFYAEEDKNMLSFLVDKDSIYHITKLPKMASFIMKQSRLQKNAPINLEKIDIFIDTLLKEMATTSKNLENQDVLTISLFMEANLPNSSKTLIDNVDPKQVDINCPLLIVDNEYLKGSSLLCLAIEKGKDFSECITSLLNKIDVNHMSDQGITAIFWSLICKDKSIIQKLLARNDLQIAGHHYGIHIFDLLRKMKDKDLTKEFVKKLHDTFSAENYHWQTPIYLPIALLTAKQQDTLKVTLLKKIEEIPLFSTNLDLKNKLLQFINDPTPLPFKSMNRLSLAFEMIAYLIHPEWIKQGDSNLCGPATLMQHLVVHNPELFIHSALEIVELNSKKPLHLPEVVNQISATTAQNAILLSELWSETIRRSYNVITGYNRDSKFEPFMGNTTPYQFEKMFADFGYKIIRENMQVQFANDNRMVQSLEKLRIGLFEPYGQLPAPFKIYGNEHENQPNNADRFDSLCQWTSSHQEITPVLLSAKLVDEMLGLNNNYLHQISNLFYVLGASHFCNLKDFRVLNDDVSFKVLTYGKEIPVLVEKDKFMEGFLGSLEVEIEPLTPKPTLQRI